MVGGFGSMIDLDPGSGTAMTPIDSGTFLTKFNSQGIYQWLATWASFPLINGTDSNAHFPVKVATDSGGNVFVAGEFSGTVDFDPGPGYANADGTIYLSKFDSFGNFQWVNRGDRTPARARRCRTGDRFIG